MFFLGWAIAFYCINSRLINLDQYKWSGIHRRGSAYFVCLLKNRLLQVLVEGKQSRGHFYCSYNAIYSLFTRQFNSKFSLYVGVCLFASHHYRPPILNSALRCQLPACLFYTMHVIFFFFFLANVLNQYSSVFIKPVAGCYEYYRTKI